MKDRIYFYCGKYAKGKLHYKQRVVMLQPAQCVNRVLKKRCPNRFKHPMNCAAYVAMAKREGLLDGAYK
jgi:hypothetical protein